MKTKTLFKRAISIMLAVMMIAAMACIGFTANAATMVYHIDTSRTASMTIYKYEMPDTSEATFVGTGEITDAANVPASATPLADVTFTITKIAELDEYFVPQPKDENKILPAVSEAQKIIADAKTDNKSLSVYSATTDENGVAQFTNLPLGIYYVEETDGPVQITEPISPFVISLPTTNQDGTQWLYDVYAYPKNQTAYSDITVKKVDANDGKVLPGAKFTLYNSADGKTYAEMDGFTGLTTGEDGTFTVEHLPAQVYYKFVETQTSDKSYILDTTIGYEFYIDNVGNVIYDGKTLDDTEGKEKVITVVNERPSIEKWVLDGEKGNKGIDNTADFNEAVYWELDVTVPANIGKLDTFTVIDTMSTGLRYTGSEITAKGVNSSGKAVSATLVKDTDYTVSQSGLTVTFAFVPGNLGEKFSGKMTDITIYFNTVLTEEAPLAKDIPNQGTLTYTNVIDTDDKTDPTNDLTTQIPNVHTGGYSFYKVNKDGAVLEGAKFSIYATEDDAKNNTNALRTTVSDEDGLVTFAGLKYGGFSADDSDVAKNGTANGSTEYWISEIESPDGYSLLSAPVKVTINANSHSADNTPSVVNTKTPDFPKTGSAGTAGLIILASLLIVAGSVLFVVRRNKRTSED